MKSNVPGNTLIEIGYAITQRPYHVTEIEWAVNVWNWFSKLINTAGGGLPLCSTVFTFFSWKRIVLLYTDDRNVRRSVVAVVSSVGRRTTRVLEQRGCWAVSLSRAESEISTAISQWTVRYGCKRAPRAPIGPLGPRRMTFPELCPKIMKWRKRTEKMKKKKTRVNYYRVKTASFC